MTDEITKHNLFRAVKSKAKSRAEATDSSARAIIAAEAERREAKTARLRQARLEREACEAASPAPAKPRRGKAVKRRAQPVA